MSSDVKQEIKSEPVGEMATEPASADAILDNLFKTITEKSVKQEPETSEGEEDSEEDSEDEEEDESLEPEQEQKNQVAIKENEEEEHHSRRKKKEKKKHKHKKDKKKKKHRERRDDGGSSSDRRRDHHGSRDRHRDKDSDRRREEDRRRDEDRGRDRRDEDRRRADRRSERSEDLIQRKSRPMSPPPVPLRQHHERPRQTSPVRHTRPLSPPPRDRDYRDRDYRDQDYRRDSRDGGDYSSRDSSSRRSRREQEERPPTRHHVKEESGGGGGGDTFWDSKWEAKELQKEADAKERRGKHFLDNSNRHHKEDTTGSKRDKSKHKSRTPSPESEELRRLKEMRAVTSLEVKESEKYVAEPEDPSQFEWNPTTKMWGRKQVEEGDLEIKEEQGPPETTEEGEEKYQGDGSFDSELQKRMQEQVKEGKRKFIPIDSAESRSLTMDEIEEIRKKREKFKKEKGEGKNDKPTTSSTSSAARPVKKEDKEEGEVGSDEEHEPKYKKPKTRELSPPPKPTRRRSRSRSRRRSRSRDTRKRSPLEPLSRGSRGGYDDYRSSKREYYHDYRGTSSRRRSRSRSRDRRRSRSRDRRRSRSRDRGGGGRRRSRDRRDGGFRSSRAEIDKAKLLAIARKNAVKLLNSDNLMGMDHDRLMAIKSGGQSLSQLTMFCRELAQKGITDEFSDDDEIINRPVNSDEEDTLHHPFAVKDRPLPNPYLAGSSMRPAIELDSLTPQARLAARSHRMIEFPVSSGNAHRVKEVLPSEAQQGKAADMPLVPLGPSTTAVALPAAEPPSPPEEAKAEVDPMEDDDNLVTAEADAEAERVAKANFSNPLGQIMFGGAVNATQIDTSLLGVPELLAENIPEPPATTEATPALIGPVQPSAEPTSVEEDTPALATSSSNGFVDPLLPQPPTAAKPSQVFDPVEAPNKDISSIVSTRLAAMKKLSSNPNDPEALREMYEAQKQMSSWAESKNKPGQFTGHTGAKVLSKAELELGVQAWAKQEQFTKAPKVSGGFGEFLLKKMGWSEGEGLGKERNGDVDPLTLDIKMDKRGLVAAEEAVSKRGKRGALTMTGIDLSGKHPVTALMELSVRRRWGAPSFVQAFECGPSHKKQYVFKVTVNGESYQPTIACDNKKKAKADAATVALQELGMVPKDPNNPL